MNFQIERLTEREREILRLLAQGNKNREIAERLSLSIRTVEKHRANLITKLKTSEPTGFVSAARQASLID